MKNSNSKTKIQLEAVKFGLADDGLSEGGLQQEPAPYLTVAKASEAEFVERKSRFIGYVCPVETELAAMEFVAIIKAKHREATHNCYAYQVGKFNEIQRSCDDGEPGGTAGRPILEGIKKLGLQNTAVVVTRYFGGILLGAGGLVRAYGKAAGLGLAAAGVVKKKPGLLYNAVLEYSLWSKMASSLGAWGLQTQEVIFLEKVTALIKVPKDFEATFIKEIENLGNGTIQLLVLDREIWLDEPIVLG